MKSARYVFYGIAHNGKAKIYDFEFPREIIFILAQNTNRCYALAVRYDNICIVLIPIQSLFMGVSVVFFGVI